MKKGRIEQRSPLKSPLDLLAQHLITLALAGGFREKETLEEVRTAWSYRKLSKQEWDWTIEFIVKGGKTLGAYDQFRRVICGMEYIQSTLKESAVSTECQLGRSPAIHLS